MKTSGKFLINTVAVVMLMLSQNLSAQHEAAWLTTLNSADSAAINALALYPDSIRLSIFEAAAHPEVIVRVGMLQQKTSDGFTGLLSTYTSEEQEEIWNLTRYPGLIEKLARNESKSKEEINGILKSYPEEVHATAMKYARSHFELLQNIERLYRNADESFHRILSGYPPATDAAMRELIEFPEVLSILNDHMQMTVLVGDMYRKNPKQLVRTVDSLNLALIQLKARDLEVWKAMVESDASLQNDLKAAAEEYAADNGYTAQEYSQTPTSTYIENYIVYPYPYWFGYPYWYPYYYWYPYPYWFDWGFYIDPFGFTFVFGLPSCYFTYWYYYYPYHYYQYPYLCNSYVSYYYGPRNVVTENTQIVRDWVNENGRFLPQDFTTNPSKHTDAVKQLGAFQADYNKYRLNSPATSVTRDEYLRENRIEYQSLTVPAKVSEAERKRVEATEVQKAPPVRLPQARIPEVPRDLNSQATKAKNLPLKLDFKKVNPAQEYHRSTWEKAAPKVQPAQRQQPSPKQPAARQQPGAGSNPKR